MGENFASFAMTEKMKANGRDYLYGSFTER